MAEEHQIGRSDIIQLRDEIRRAKAGMHEVGEVKVLDLLEKVLAVVEDVWRATLR